MKKEMWTSKTRNSFLRLMASVTVTGLVAVFAGFDCSDAQMNTPVRVTHVQGENTATVYAPEFPDDARWLNTDTPLSIKKLRGKIVLVDFWTYCCINCMHVLPDLKRLEKKYPEHLVVIGVHSAKFETEKDVSNIRQAILRYDIEHPVVNDADMRIWDEYAVRAWPTLVLIDPEGRVVGSVSGEGNFDRLDAAISRLIERYEGSDMLNVVPMDFRLEREQARPETLSFPGKVLADEASGRLFISDSNHNRILITDLQGNTRTVIGSGRQGRRDGSFAEARFNHPQGLALNGNALYIADTENHTIREADLQKQTVSTEAGTGVQARAYNRKGYGLGLALNSPWDVLHHDGALYVAMAGFHQIWKMRLDDGWIAPYAGTGREALDDGPLIQSALAQPSGLTTDGSMLYFADSETSSIRTADIGAGGAVNTLVGQGLFVFGDTDGTGSAVRLQHPLGVAYSAGKLYVADTYNNKIKLLLPQRRQVITLLGTGEAGLADGGPEVAQFDEPGGLSLAGSRLYVADTNNHRIRMVDLETVEVTTLHISGAPDTDDSRSCPAASTISASVAPGSGEIVISINLPEGLKLNEDGPSEVAIDGGGVASFDGASVRSVDITASSMRIPARFHEGSGEISVRGNLYYCSDEGTCFFAEALLTAEVTVTQDSEKREVPFHWDVQTP